MRAYQFRRGGYGLYNITGLRAYQFRRGGYGLYNITGIDNICFQCSEFRLFEPNTSRGKNKKNMGALLWQIKGLNFTKKELELSFKEKFKTYPNRKIRLYGKKNASGSKRPVESNLRSKNVATPQKNSYRKYGGQMAAILQALESTENIDEALDPWKANLRAKGRSVILNEQSNWERAVQIFRWFQEKGCYETNEIHYTILFKILGRAQKWDHLKEFWDEMVRGKVSPTNTTYSTLIHVYGKAGLNEEALSWFDHMVAQGLHIDEVITRAVVQCLKKAGEYDKAAQFFQDWSSGKNSSQYRLGIRNSSPNMSINGVTYSRRLLEDKPVAPCIDNDVGVQRPLNPRTYNILIDTHGKAGHLKAASEVFQDMLKEGIFPNTVTFNTIIHICGSHGCLDEADALMVKMEELRCVPDTVSYNTLIALHAKNDNIDRAWWYFTKMKEAGLIPNAASYRSILYAFSKRYMVNEVVAVIQEMDEVGAHVDEYHQSAVIRMYIGLGLLDKAWAWFERFHLDGQMTSKCYAANIDAYGEQGYWSEAEKVFNCSQEREKNPSVLEFNVMIKAYGISKFHDKALQLFESMEIRGVLPDRSTYSSLIQMLATSDCVDDSKCFISKMQEEGFILKCGSFSAVIAACKRLGRTVEAEEMYEWMLKEHVEADIFVYGTLIDAFAEAGNVEKALHYFRVMKDDGFVANPVVYSSLIKVFSKCGLLKEARETFKMMKQLGNFVDVFSSNCMIDLYNRAGMVSEAHEIFQDLKEKGQANEFSFAMMLCLYKKDGRFMEATEIAKEMLESVVLADVRSFNNIIGLYVIDGRFREAAKVLQKMLKLEVSPDEFTRKILGNLLMRGGISRTVVKQLEGSQIRGSMQLLIVTVYSIVGMPDQALEVLGPLNELKDLNPDISVFNAIIYAFGSAGKMTDAFGMFMTMQALGLEPDTTTYLNMIISYQKSGLVEGVRRMFEQMKQRGCQPNDAIFRAVIDAYKSADWKGLAKIVTQERYFTLHLLEHSNFDDGHDNNF